MAKAKAKAKSVAKSTATDTEAPPHGGALGSGKLKKAVWYKGKMYDPKKKGDAEAFAQVVAKDKDAAKHIQRLAGKKVVSGFGTTKKAEDAEDTGSAPIGGGVEGVEEEDVETEPEE